MSLDEIVHYFRWLQDSICGSLETLDGAARFQSDIWQRPEGGGGDSRVIVYGNVFEKGGVNFSHVYGAMPDVLRSETRNAGYFHATGVSIVIHPQNPFVPIIHMNVRYFEMRDQPDGPVADAWFGGGIDLSPAYPNTGDAKFFHTMLKQVCDKHHPEYYNRFKPWCDEYFTIRHRNQMRGIGGIFFDHLRPESPEHGRQLFDFVKEVGETFVPVYSELVHRNKERLYTLQNKEWQLIRRGYYAEFNLVYDRGTHFGLRTNGRIESILMSLPPIAAWKYNFQPEQGSDEWDAMTFFQPRDWIS